MDRNLGFAAANNAGIIMALAEDYDCVLLLNQDIVVQANAVQSLVAQLRQWPEYGLISCFQLNYEGNSIDQSFRTYVPPEFYDDLYFNKLRPLYRCDFMPAAAVLIRREVFGDLGAFDPMYFLYKEDDDFCRRLRLRGWLIGVVPNAKVQHWHSFVRKTRTLQWQLNWEYSEALYHIKWSPQFLPVAFCTLVKRYLKNPSFQVGTAVARVTAIFRCILAIPTLIARRKELLRAPLDVPLTIRSAANRLDETVCGSTTRGT
jgi:GT2 family glycosyltransferase